MARSIPIDWIDFTKREEGGEKRVVDVRYIESPKPEPRVIDVRYIESPKPEPRVIDVRYIESPKPEPA